MPRSHLLGRRRGAALAGLSLVGALAGCGSSSPSGDGGDPTSAPPATTGGTIVACADVPPLGPIRDSDQPSMSAPSAETLNAIAGYTGRHRDTFAGSWIDRDHGGTFVFASTDDPADHRDAIAAYRSQAGDDVAVVTSPPEPGTGVPATSGPPATTLGESDWPIDVVQARFTEAELRATHDRLLAELRPVAPVGLGMNVQVELNRVRVDLPADDLDVRATIARTAPADQVCIQTPTPDPDRPRVSTVLPTERDPWVSCAGLTVRRSATESPEPLERVDPLLVAVRRDLATQPGMDGGAGEWFLLARTGDEAVVVRREPTPATARLRRSGDRWSVGGSGSGGAEACDGRVLLPDGLLPVRLAFDPAFGPPGPNDTTVHLLVSEAGCTGGRDLRPALIEPEVREERGRVLVGYAARAPEGDAHTCPARAPDPIALTLPSRLGSRQLLDGTYVPPRPIEPGGGRR